MCMGVTKTSPRVSSAEVEGMEKEQLDGPPSKTRRLSLSRKKPLREANHFSLPTDPDLVEKAAKGVILYNTLDNTNWAVGPFLFWVKQRNQLVPEKIDPDILSCGMPSFYCMSCDCSLWRQER